MSNAIETMQEAWKKVVQLNKYRDASDVETYAEALRRTEVAAQVAQAEALTRLADHFVPPNTDFDFTEEMPF